MEKNWTIELGDKRLEARINLHQDHPTIRFVVPKTHGYHVLHTLSGKAEVLKFVNLTGFQQMELMQELLGEFEIKKPVEPVAEVIPIDRDVQRFSMLEF